MAPPSEPGVRPTPSGDADERLAILQEITLALNSTLESKKLVDYLAACRRAGQEKPTPLLLRYREKGFNCLHRDLYGEMQFPIQAMVMLSEPGRDFEGGEFLLVENRARRQSQGIVLTPRRGDLVLFAGNERPVQGMRGVVRASMRHGVSRLVRGERFALGIIFHNAS